MHVRDLRDCSGPWRGFWIQELIRGNMRLDLHFSGGDITGGGTDPMGRFELAGIFSDLTGGVLFTVTYTTHKVEYSGVWDGQFIYGKWTLHDEQFTEIGDFEIWPEKEETPTMVATISAGDEVSMPSFSWSAGVEDVKGP